MKMNKQQLRSALRGLNEGRQACETQNAQICHHILDSAEYKGAHIIGGYIPMAHEADILPVLQDALRQEKTLALPLCGKPPCMTLRIVRKLEELTPGAYGIPEPPAESEIIPTDKLDLLLVPLEGIDRSGCRLGKGGGYYDRLLADTDVLTVGCAFSWQWVEKLPKDPWDRSLYFCADAEGLHRFVQDAHLKKGSNYGNEKEAAEN